MQRVSGACGQLGAGGFERAVQNGGGAALLGAEVGVARRERETIRLADDGTDYDFGIEIQVARHLRDDADLLRVLAAEISEVRLHDLQELHDDGGDATKMAGTRTAFEAVAEPFNGDIGAEAGGVNFGSVGAEEDGNAGGG